MRSQHLVAAAAALICVLALLNLTAEQLHWQRGYLLHPRAELLRQKELRLDGSTAALAAPPPRHLSTAAGAQGPAHR